MQPTSSKKIRKHIPQEDGVVGYAEEKEVSYQKSFWPRVKIEPLENIKYLSPVVKNDITKVKLELQNRAYEQLQVEKMNVERQMKELLDRELDYLKEDRVKEAALKNRLGEMEEELRMLQEEKMKAAEEAQDEIKNARKTIDEKNDLLSQLTNRVVNLDSTLEAIMTEFCPPEKVCSFQMRN